MRLTREYDTVLVRDFRRILDFGQVNHKGEREKVRPHTGRLLVLEPLNAPATQPTTTSRPNK